MDDSTAFALDDTDFRVLRELNADGRVSDVDLGERVHLSSTAAARRRKILEDRGVIRGYTADLDITALGYGIVVLVAVELSSQAEKALIEFETAVVGCPSMSFCSFVTGDNDFIMIVHARSVDDYNRIYRAELSQLPNVARIRSSFVMREVAERMVAPIILSGGDKPPPTVSKAAQNTTHKSG